MQVTNLSKAQEVGRAARKGYENATEMREVSGKIAYNIFHPKPTKSTLDIYRFEDNSMWMEVFWPSTDREREIYEQIPSELLKLRAFHAVYKDAMTARPDSVMVEPKTGNVQLTYASNITKDEREALAKQEALSKEGYLRDFKGYDFEIPGGGSSAPAENGGLQANRAIRPINNRLSQTGEPTLGNEDSVPLVAGEGKKKRSASGKKASGKKRSASGKKKASGKKRSASGKKKA